MSSRRKTKDRKSNKEERFCFQLQKIFGKKRTKKRKKKKKKGRSLTKKQNCVLVRLSRSKWKQFRKILLRTRENIFLNNMEVYSEKKRERKIWQKRCYKKWMWWRRDDVDRGLRPCRSPHNTIFTTHAIWFFTTLSGWLHQVFSYEWWEKASASRQGHWPLHRCTALFGTSTVFEPSKFGELVFPSQTAMHWSTTTSSCTTLSSTMCKMNNSTSQTTVSSRPLFSFGFFSCPFLHPCSSIIPTLHHFVLTTPSFSFSECCSAPKLCKGASTSHQWTANCFLWYLWIGSSPKPCWI